MHDSQDWNDHSSFIFIAFKICNSDQNLSLYFFNYLQASSIPSRQINSIERWTGKHTKVRKSGCTRDKTKEKQKQRKREREKQQAYRANDFMTYAPFSRDNCNACICCVSILQYCKDKDKNWTITVAMMHGYIFLLAMKHWFHRFAGRLQRWNVMKTYCNAALILQKKDQRCSAYAALRQLKVGDMCESMSSFPLRFALLSVRKSINTDRNTVETKIGPFLHPPL